MKLKTARLCATAALLAVIGQANAFEWSDTSIGYRYGTDFQEPYNGKNIAKNIVNLSHADGYKYGNNFFNIDMLMSDQVDSKAQEAYVVYRHTLDFAKVTGSEFKFGPVRGLGLTAGFDWNTKNDPGYASRKRMLVLGPTVKFEVPGFLDVSLLALRESNQPVGIADRYTYRAHAMLTAAWGIPVGSTGLSFEGFMNYIAAKGTNEFGGATAPETNIDMALMYDLGTQLGWSKNSVRAGVGYQYWRNKFGNPSNVPGSLARTPMVKVDFHF